MFKIESIKSLEKWNVSNGKNFSFMFSLCKSLLDKTILEKWNIRNDANISDIFFDY